MINKLIKHTRHSADNPTVSWCLQLYATPLGTAYTIDNAYARGIMQNAMPQTMRIGTPINTQDNRFNWNSGLGKAAIGMGAGVAGGLLYKGISDGYSSTAGNVVNTVGNGVGDVLMAVNPVVGGIVKLGATGLGALTNRAFGAKWSDDNIQRIEGTTALNRSIGNNLASASTTGQLAEGFGMANAGLNFTKGDIGRDGWFTHKVGRKYNKLTNQYNASNNYLSHGLAMGAKRVNDMQDNIAIANTAAYGGLFDMLGNTGMGAVDYGFMNDYITSRQKKASDNNAFSNYIPIPSTFGIGGTLFPLGGDLQTHGSDWSTGTKVIDAGGLHETNPNEGVQMGMDSQGTPNLVEEGEVVYNDYVYSNRIKADAETKKAFHINEKRDITIAELAKKLGKEIDERRNDPISKNGYNADMQNLAEHQERQKQEMEAQKAREAFEALSPDEQMALISQMAAQQQQAPQSPDEEAMMQEQAAQEQMMAEQQMQGMPQGSLMQQAQMGIEGGVPQEQMMQQPQMAAYGGSVNKFDKGGQAYINLLNSLGFHTQEEFEDWARENHIDVSSIWGRTPKTLNNDILGRLWNNAAFNEALKKINPALAHVFKEYGYNWGALGPEGEGNGNGRAIESIDLGNWKATNGAGWYGSKDSAFLEATKGMTEDEIKALTTEQLAEKMKATDAYKRTNEWLKNSDNALFYLNTLLNDPNTPEVAKQYARKFVTDGKWKNGFNYDYATVFGANGKGVRETNPGTYWHTALPAVRKDRSGNFLIDDDGSIKEIVGDVPADWSNIGNYTFADEVYDSNYNYYKKPTVAAPAATTPPAEDIPDDSLADYEPVKHQDWMRYAGIAGPIVAAGLQGLGFGRPDYSRLDAAVDAYNNATRGVADYKPIGNYMRYTPMDIWSEQNRLNANARATDRAIANSGLTAGNRMAGLIAANYGNQVASSDLMKKAMEYNLGENKAVQDFNRGTDQFNASSYNQTSLSNAQMLNQDRQYRGSLAMQAAKERLDTDASWYNSFYGNISGAFRGLADVGRENREANWRNWLASKGYFDIPAEELERTGMVKRRTT